MIGVFIGMNKYVCIPYEYVYAPEVGDPENEILPGTRFEDLSDDWQCPVCFVDKDEFKKIEA
jgi:rubredoxin